jgi:hypothetical protein
VVSAFPDIASVSSVGAVQADGTAAVTLFGNMIGETAVTVTASGSDASVTVPVTVTYAEALRILSVSASGGLIKASVSNTTGSGMDLCLLCAAYNASGQMPQVASQTLTVARGYAGYPCF